MKFSIRIKEHVKQINTLCTSSSHVTDVSLTSRSLTIKELIAVNLLKKY